MAFPLGKNGLLGNAATYNINEEKEKIFSIKINHQNLE